MLTDATLSLIAFKNLLGKSITETIKGLGNEAEGIAFNVHSDTIFVDNVDTDPAVAVAAGVAIFVDQADLTADPTSNGKAFFAEWPSSPPSGTDPTTSSPYAYGAGLLTGISSGDRITNAINPSFGVGYEAKPSDTGATPIPVDDPKDWIYQYQSGIYFQQDVVGPTPGFIDVYAYTGDTLTNALGGGGGGGGITAVAVADIDDPSTELNAIAGNFEGEALLTYEVDGTSLDSYTLYVFDGTNTDSEVIPYTIDASGGGKWTALTGKYMAQEANIRTQLTVGGAVTIKLNGVIQVPVFGSDPSGLVNGDVWITDSGSTVLLNTRTSGVNKSVELS